MSHHGRATPFLFLLPYLIVFAIFLGYPILRGFYISLFDWGIFGARDFLGIGNYIRLSQSPRFWRIFNNTLFFAAIFVPMSVILSLIIAVLLREESAGIRVYRTLFFMPLVINVSVAAIAINFILNTQVGVLNRTLALLNLPTQAWLQRAGWATLVVAIAMMWRTAGVNIIIYLAGLGGIPREYYEVAETDGAKRWQSLLFITLPLLKPVILLVAVLSTVQALQVFGEIYILTDGGPHGSTSVLAYRLYTRGFRDFQFGEAAAIGVILTALIALISLVQFRLLRSERQ